MTDRSALPFHAPFSTATLLFLTDKRLDALGIDVAFPESQHCAGVTAATTAPRHTDHTIESR